MAVKVKRDEYGCSPDRQSPDYCPVITVGASYPGFLSAMLRLVHGDVVDIAYASSAPLKLYAQYNLDPNAYFDKLSQVSNRLSPGCIRSVKESLLNIQNEVQDTDDDSDNDDNDDKLRSLAKRMGICAQGGELPVYIKTEEVLWNEVLFAIASNFADFNMENYPPSPNNDLIRACQAFEVASTDTDDYGKLRKFWQVVQTSVDYVPEEGEQQQSEKCFDLRVQIPAGPRGTVTCSDWTGCGGGISGLSWDFQLCTELIVQTGYSSQSMFPTHPWTYNALKKHCQSRFGVNPTPTRLVDMWHFDDLAGQKNATRFIFTNGLNDGWSSLSILDSIPSQSIVALNMPNGAHRSDLYHFGPISTDTDDIRETRLRVIDTLTQWLTEIKATMYSGNGCH